MKAMQCELCGGTEIVKDGDFFVCQSCGMKYTLETARKMMVEGVVEVKGTVKQDRSDELVRLLELARGGLDSSNFKDAENYAMRALEIDLNNGKAWAIKAEAIDWQMTLADEREAETAQARFEMYKLLRKTTDNIADILDATEVISKHEKHVKRIVQAETSLFTQPLESAPGSKESGYVNKLVKHIEFRKTEFESVQTLARLWKLQAEKTMGQSEELESNQRAALENSIKTLGAIVDSTPQAIADMHIDAAKALNDAAKHGFNGESVKWWNDYVNLAVNGSSAAKKRAFDRFTEACDACAVAFLTAALLLELRYVSEKIDHEDLENRLYLYYKNLCLAEDQCIDHSFPQSWEFADAAKASRRKQLVQHQEARDSHDPEIKKKKHEEAIQNRMSELFSDAWDKDPRKAVVEQCIQERKSAQDQLTNLKNELGSLGFFRRKEKADLEVKIAEVENKIKQIDSSIESEENSFREELHSIAAGQLEDEKDLQGA